MTITNCRINTPRDDALVLKSSYALKKPVLCEHIAVSNCNITGYKCGSLLDGTYIPDEGIAAMLQPHRCKIAPLKLNKTVAEDNNKAIKTASGKAPEKKKEGFCRRCLNWWSTLRVRERKVIFGWIKAAIIGAITIFAGSKQTKSRRK